MPRNLSFGTELQGTGELTAAPDLSESGRGSLLIIFRAAIVLGAERSTLSEKGSSLHPGIVGNFRKRLKVYWHDIIASAGIMPCWQ